MARAGVVAGLGMYLATCGFLTIQSLGLLAKIFYLTIRTIKYSGTYNATGPGYLAVYGWTRNPLIEYYILESYADLAPNEPWFSIIISFLVP